MNKELYEILLNRILKLEYKPGEVLHESDLEEEFGVGKSAIKTVLRRLENEELLKIIPRTGANIAPINIGIARQAFEFRRELEGIIASLCVEKACEKDLAVLRQLCAAQKDALATQNANLILEQDMEWHKYILEICNNEFLSAATTKVLHLCERMFNYVFGDPFSQGFGIYDFADELAAIENKDADKARDLARNHVADSYLAIKNKTF